MYKVNKILLVSILFLVLVLPVYSLAKENNSNGNSNSNGNNNETEVESSATPEVEHSNNSTNNNDDLNRNHHDWQQEVENFKNAQVNERETKLKDIANTVIENRISLLTNLKSLILSNTNISQEIQQNLVKDIDTTISQLQDLKSNLTSMSDLNSIKDNIRSIFETYRVYSVVAPRDLGQSLVAQGNYILGRLQALQRNLQTMIEQKKNEGKDITSLNSLVTQFDSQIQIAKEQLAIADTKFKSMTPANTEAAKTAREEGKAAFKKAKDALKEAHNILKEISNQLKEMGPSVSPSPSTVVSPTISPVSSISPSPISSPSSTL